MSIDYESVIKRLRKERERMSWSQREMCQYMCMSQAQYCKIENGEQYFSYDEVKRLSDLEMDIHYIFTGQRGNVRYRKELDECSYIEIICLLETIFSIITHRYVLEKSDFWKKLYGEVQFIRLLDANANFDNIFFFLLRCLAEYTQKEMAGVLGVDVKKLRRLEKGQCLPDSELLWQLYKEFRVPPSILLKDRNGLLNEACWLLERIDSVLEEDILMIIKAFKKTSCE